MQSTMAQPPVMMGDAGSNPTKGTMLRPVRITGPRAWLPGTSSVLRVSGLPGFRRLP